MQGVYRKETSVAWTAQRAMLETVEKVDVQRSAVSP